MGTPPAGPPTGPSGVDDPAGRIAVLCRAEQLLFAALGDGATRYATPTSASVLATAADHAAWRARRWYELLPTAPPGPDALLVATDADVEVTASVRDHVVDDITLLAVVAIELLPRVRRSMEIVLEATDPVADGPVRRIVGIALTDLETDVGELLGAYEERIRESAERDRADEAVGAVAAVAARTGWPVPGV